MPPKEGGAGETLQLLKCGPTGKFCDALQCACCGRAITQRFVMTILIMMMIIMSYTHRVCLSLAITEMTMPKNTTVKKSVDPEECPAPSGHLGRPVIMDIQGGKFDWDEGIQSYILLAFYVGYLTLTIPAGYLCDLVGARWVMTIGFFISSVTTLLIPPAAIYTSWHVVVVLRLISGLGQSPLYPGVTQLQARWVPEAERSLVGSVVMSSLCLGTIAGNLPSVLILEYYKSWVWIFYFYGILGVALCAIFLLYVYSTPVAHPHITPEENEYLESRIAIAEKHKVPIKAILSDLVVWGCIICQFGNDYTFYTIVTNLPKYLNDVLKVSSRDVGFLVCIPQICMFIGALIFGPLTDALIVYYKVKVVTMRVINTILATLVPAIGFFICCKLRCNPVGAIGIISAAMFIRAMFYCGLKVTIIDITKYHTGLVAAMATCAGGAAGVIAPYTIGKVASDNTFKQWDLVAYITVLFGSVTIIPYAIFCKAERKPWDYAENPPPPAEGTKTGCISVFSCVNRH